MHRTRLWLNDATRQCWRTASACSASAPRSGCERRHEAGALHCPGYGGTATGAGLAASAVATVDTLLTRRSGRRPCAVRADGALDGRRGRRPRARRRARHAGATSLDEADFRARAAAFRDAFATPSPAVRGRRLLRGQGVPVHRRSRAGSPRRGCARRLHRRRARGRAAGRRPPERIALHGNNKSDRGDRPGARRPASAGSSSTRSPRSTGSPTLAARHGRRPPVMVRVTTGVEAHTHEYIVDRARGPEVRPLARPAGEAARGGARGCSRPPELELRRPALPHRLADLRHRRASRSPPRRLLGLHAADRSATTAWSCREVDLGGGYGIAYTSEHDPLDPKLLADQLAEIVARECRGLGIAVPRVSSSPAARSPARARSRSTRSARSRTCRSTTAPPGATSRSTAA